MNKNELIKFITSTITKSVKSGMYVSEYDGEEPTFDRIKASIPQMMLGVDTQTYDEIIDAVYKKLRKNGILAAIRKAA